MKILTLLIIIFSLCGFSCGVTLAQSPSTFSLDILGMGTGLSGYAGFNKSGNSLDNKRVMDYSDITGSCFWNDQWNSALLIGSRGEKVKLRNAKLNFYSKEIHFLENDGGEYTILNKEIIRIAFLDRKDSLRISALFQRFDDFKDLGKSFVQILNTGKIQLLKMTEVDVRKGEFNTYRLKNAYHFVSKIKYFILNEHMLVQLKGLTKTSILSVVKSDSGINTWLKSKGYKLKNEKEVVEFLNFCNSSTN